MPAPGYTIRPGMQKFNVRVHFSKNCTEIHFASVTFRMGPWFSMFPRWLEQECNASGLRDSESISVD